MGSAQRRAAPDRRPAGDVMIVTEALPDPDCGGGMWAAEGPYWGSRESGKMQWIVRIAPCLLAHYFSAAYRYGSEELLRAPRIAIRPLMFLQLRGIEDVTSAGGSADGWVPTDRESGV